MATDPAVLLNGAFSSYPLSGPPSGYVLAGRQVANKDGLYVEAYKRIGSSDYIVSFRGTDPTLEDIATDFNLGWPQYDFSRDAIQDLLKDLLAEGGQVDITGHSLGGALAQFAAYDLAADESSSQFDLNRLTLTTWNGLGGQWALERHADYDATVASRLTARHYFRSDDLVARFGKGHVGGVMLRLDDPEGQLEGIVPAHMLAELSQSLQAGSWSVNEPRYFRIDDRSHMVLGDLMLGALQISRPGERLEGLVRMNVSMALIQLGYAPWLRKDLNDVIGQAIAQELISAAQKGLPIVAELGPQILAMLIQAVRSTPALLSALMDGVEAWWSTQLSKGSGLGQRLSDSALQLAELLIRADAHASVAPFDLQLWQLEQRLLGLDGMVEEDRRRLLYALPGRPDLSTFNNLMHEQMRLALLRFNCPLLLDLDGDGIETLALETAGVRFDLNDDGRAAACGWVGPDDALLVRDRNGDGRIGSGAELFGNRTLLADGRRAEHGFAALADLDADGNGRIDRLDPAWRELALWRDRNSDGLLDAGEWLDLAGLGITALMLETRPGSGLDAQGNDVRQSGHYRRENGSWLAMADVWFAQSDALPAPPSTPTATPPSTATADGAAAPLAVSSSDGGDSDALPSPLPDLRGLADLPSLRRTINQDSSGRLRQLLEQWQRADASGRAALVPDILYHWTGVADLPSGGSLLPDARMLEALHVLTRNLYRHIPLVNDVGAAELQVLFEELCRIIGALLETRDSLSPRWARMIQIAPDGLSLQLDPQGFEEALQDQLSHAGSDADLARASRALRGFPLVREEVMRRIRQRVLQDSQQPDPRLLLLAVENHQRQHDLSAWRWNGGQEELLEGTETYDYLYGFAGNDVILSHGGNDSIDGGLDDDLIISGSGNDIIRDWEGNDTIIAGVGDDEIEVNLGSNLLLFHPGDGKDRILIHSKYLHDSSRYGQNTLQFVGAITPQDVRVTRLFSHMRLQLMATGDSLLLLDFFAGDLAAPPLRPLHAVRFPDGTTWDITQLIQRAMIGGDGPDYLEGTVAHETLDGAAGQDTLLGAPGQDLLLGGSGTDTLNGGSGSNTLIGGAGNDMLRLGEGNDLLLYRLGDGHDTLAGGSSSSWIELSLGPGLSSQSVLFNRQNTSLRLSIPLAGAEFHLQDFFQNNRCEQASVPLHSLRFEDGSSWGWQDLLARSMQGDERDNALTGLISADTLRGAGGNDSLAGLEGDDLLQGDSGNDTLVAQAGRDRLEGGDGDDTFQSWSLDGEDTLVGGSGSNLFLIQSGAVLLAANPSGASSVFNTLHMTRWGITELSLIRDDRMLLIRTPSADLIQVEDFFRDGQVQNPWNPLQVLRPASGSSLDARSLASRVSNSFLGSSSGNKLIGRDSDDWFDGLGGNDLLQGLGGHDVLRGDAGNDTLQGGAGNDLLQGGEGSDTASWTGQSGAVQVDLSLEGPQDSGNGHDHLVGIEHLQGGGGADQLWGNAGANRLDGGDHDDWLEGGEGNDTLVGGNHLAGGDTVSYGRASAGVQVNLALSSAQNTLGAGVDLLSGLEHLQGSSLHDTLSGSAAANRIEAGGGDDTLRGGAGADSLMGGDGADRFLYGTASEAGLGAGLRDWISDLSESDRIDLTAIDAHGEWSGNQAFVWIGSAPFTAPGQLRLTSLSTGNGLLEGNISGATAAEFQLELPANAASIAAVAVLL